MRIAITLGPIFLLLAVAIAAGLMSRAWQTLTTEQKAAIFDSAPKNQAWFFVTLAILLGVFSLLAFYGPLSRWVFAAFPFVFLPLMIIQGAAHLRRLSLCAAPPAYISAVRRGLWIVWIGAAVLFTVSAFSMWASLSR